MTTVAEFVIDAPPEAWRSVGFDVDSDGLLQLGGIRIRLTHMGPLAAVADPSGDPVADPNARSGTGRGLSSWVLADAPDVDVAEIDGLPTAHASAPPQPGPVHPNGVVGIDHVVVYTPDLERTCAAIAAATGAPLKRVREAGSVRQGFHRLGQLIVEVVTSPQVSARHAVFWGLAFNVSDIDAIYTRCGRAMMSPPKHAVQQGRRIASFYAAAGLGVPVAVMTVEARNS